LVGGAGLWPAPQVPPPVPADWKLKVIGAHNRENASFAAAALRALGLPDEEIKLGLESFEPVEGRLQLIREIGGIKIYNDNNATTPEAAIVALRALDAGKKNIILIIGGADKGLDADALITEVKPRCKRVMLLAGTGTVRLQEELSATEVFPSLKGAFDAALKSADEGDVILFSPAFASFGMFKNEYERNDEFKRLVQAAGAA
jgi:UDP-N-acetylmuramoylalanine--D-glutamate ligase